MPRNPSDSELINWAHDLSALTLSELRAAAHSKRDPWIVSLKRLRRLRGLAMNCAVMRTNYVVHRDDLGKNLSVAHIEGIAGVDGLAKIADYMEIREPLLLGALYESNPNTTAWYFEVYGEPINEDSTYNTVASSIFGREIRGPVTLVKNSTTKFALDASLTRDEVTKLLWYYFVSGVDPAVVASQRTVERMLTSTKLLLDPPPSFTMDAGFTSGAWLGALVFLSSRTPGSATRMVLATFDAEQLFRAAIMSKRLFRAILDFLDHMDTPDVEEDAQDDDEQETDSDSESGGWLSDEDMEGSILETPDVTPLFVSAQPLAVNADADPAAITSLPIELGQRILQDLNLASRVQFAHTSVAGACAVAESLRSAATQVLKQFDLTFNEVRLIQTATGALISGSTIPAVMHPGSFRPNDLDFYAKHMGGFDVVQFLRRSGKFKQTKRTPPYDTQSGIGQVFTLRHKVTRKKVHVVESLTEEPLDAVVQFHSSAVIGAWTANEFWHGYARLTADHISMTTLSRMPVTHSFDQQEHTRRILRKYVRRGFIFKLNEFDQHHRCGIHPSCPATVRTTNDDGCLSTSFPTWDYSADALQHKICCWTMAGTGCTAGILSNAGSVGTVASAATALPLQRWAHVVNTLSDRAEPLREIYPLV
ncbi:hypothetical protein B0H16DRAFT_1728707 [Mycena metata]|uniref:Uncharacterized protein n=1 Tax=Mycena metata TaxID=1033252 RepID=A0AAD7IGB4_9AGAR|nr:hypothetical protein B0H16DRAFT_1728707 [Mycena metata]